MKIVTNYFEINCIISFSFKISSIDLYFLPRSDHCVVKKGGLSQKVLTAMQFSINGKARQFETSAELSKILAEYRFVPIPIRKTAAVRRC